MKTSETHTRMVARKRYTNYDAEDAAILAAARRCIGANHRQAAELSDPERERRVAEYARQVEKAGRITRWLPPAEPRTTYHSRFADGDVLGRHLGSCTA